MKDNSMVKYQMDKVIKSTISGRITRIKVVYVIYFKKKGKCYYAEGTVYEGEFKNEKPNGKGIHFNHT